MAEHREDHVDEPSTKTTTTKVQKPGFTDICKNVYTAFKEDWEWSRKDKAERKAYDKQLEKRKAEVCK